MERRNEGKVNEDERTSVNFEKGSWLPFSIIISCNEHHRARRFRRAFNALRETIPVGLFEPRGRLPSEFPPFPLCVHIEEGRGRGGKRYGTQQAVVDRGNARQPRRYTGLSILQASINRI